jgi:hypothetical protein
MKRFLALSCFVATFTYANAQTIDDDWIFSVAYIGNESTGGGGTGFFVSREFETNKNMIFLVSNRLAKAKVVITREQDVLCCQARC